MGAGGSSGGRRGSAGRDADASGDVDRLIREVAHGHRTPTGREIMQLRDHVASAPFNPHRVRAASSLRGLMYQGRTVQSIDESGFVHLVKRVVHEQQWKNGTTLGEYLNDLQRVAKDTSSKLGVFDRGQGPVALFYGSNHIPEYRRGSGAEVNIIAIYHADRRSIITGYQVSDLREVDIPESVQWLT